MTVSIYKRGKTWWMRYSVNGQRYFETCKTRNKTLAETIAKKRHVEIVEGCFLNKRKDPKILFKDFSQQYYERHALQRNRRPDRAKSILKRLVQVFGKKLLSEVKRADIDLYIADRLKQGVEKSTVNREISVIKVMYRLANDWDITDSNPAKKVQKFSERVFQRDRFLTIPELERLLCVCSENLRQYLLVLIFSGLRRGEVLNLTWSCVDFDNNCIQLNQTKNGKRRYQHMNETVKQALLRLKVRRTSDEERIFPPQRGGKQRSFRTAFANACKRARIVNLRVHDLRHTFASHLVMRGVDMLTVSELLGHSSVEMTKRYSHLCPKHMGRSVKVLDGLIDTNLIHSTQDSSEKEVDRLLSQIF